MWRIGLAAALCVALVACSEEEEPVYAKLGSGGGTLASRDGRLILEVPPGAVTQETTFSVVKTGSSASGHVGAAYQIGPSGMTFKYPVKLSMTYDGIQLNGRKPADLWVAKEHKGQWRPVIRGYVDEKKKVATAEVSRFSKYALLFMKLHRLLAAFSEDSSTKNPCQCDTDVFKKCCLSSGPLNPKLKGSWTTILSLRRCGCANADGYALADCYEKQAGYDFFGCTSCERKCCKAAGVDYVSYEGECTCLPYSAGEVCLKSCKNKDEHLTLCELYRSNNGNIELSKLDNEDHKAFWKLLMQILNGKDPSVCAPALTAYMKGSTWHKLHNCHLRTKELALCAAAIAKSWPGCPGFVCQKTCPGLGQPAGDMGIKDARTDGRSDGPPPGDFMVTDGPVSPVSSDLIALRWNSTSKKEEVGVMSAKNGGFKVIGHVGDLATWGTQCAIIGKTLYVIGYPASSTTNPKLYAVDLSTGKLTGSVVMAKSYMVPGVDTKGRLIAWRVDNDIMNYGALDGKTGKLTTIGTMKLASYTTVSVVVLDTLFVLGQDSIGGSKKLYSLDLTTGKLLNSPVVGLTGVILVGGDTKGRLIARRFDNNKLTFGFLDPKTGQMTTTSSMSLYGIQNISTMAGDIYFLISPVSLSAYKLFSWNVTTGKLLNSPAVGPGFTLAGGKP